MNKKLTAKQQMFVKEYLVDLNATQAAIRAGYSKKTAAPQAARLLINVNVQAAIQKQQAKRAEKVELNQEYVLTKLRDIAEMDALDILNDDGSIKPISEWPKVWRQFLSGFDIVQLASASDIETVVKKIKWPDKVKNLELIGKHLGMFTERVELDMTDNLISAIMAGRQRASKS